MKKSRFVRMIILVLAIVTVFAFNATAYAWWYQGIEVHGSDAQVKVTDFRSEPNSMDVEPTYFNWLGESGLKFRGYREGTDTRTTELKSIYFVDQVYCANYITSVYASMDVKMSIASTNVNDYMVLDAEIKV